MDYRTLHMKTVVELRQLAKELKVKVPAGTAKSRLVELVLEGQLAAAERAKAAQEGGFAPALPAAGTAPADVTPVPPAGEAGASTQPAPVDEGAPAPARQRRPRAKGNRQGRMRPPIRRERGRKPPGNPCGGDVRQSKGRPKRTTKDTPMPRWRKRQDRRLAQCRPLRRPAWKGRTYSPPYPLSPMPRKRWKRWKLTRHCPWKRPPMRQDRP